MKSKKDIVKWLLKNCVDANGNININNLDFGEFRGSILQGKYTCKGDIFQGGHKNRGLVYQSEHANKGCIHQSHHENYSYIVQKEHKNTGYIFQQQTRKQKDYDPDELRERLIKILTTFVVGPIIGFLCAGILVCILGGLK